MKPAKITIRSDRDRATARKWVDAAPAGYTLWFKPPVRSTDQNARLWAALDDVAAQKTHDGQKRTSEQWKDLFTACLRQQEIVRGLEGGLVAFGARTSEMSPEEMSDLLQLIEAWGAQNGVTFTDQVPPGPGGETRAESDTGAMGPDSARTTSERAT